MNKLALIATWFSAAVMLSDQTGNYELKRRFVSPDSSLTAAVGTQTSAQGYGHPPIHFLGAISNGSFVRFQELPPSQYFAEYHGMAWIEDVQPRWIDNRFLIFADPSGLAIADFQTQRLLVDHVFTGYEKSPIGNRWAAIRLRATDRLQSELTDDFQDTVLVIDPYDVANEIANAAEDNFVGQMKAAKPGGIVLAKPEWAPDGSTFAILTWNRGATEAVRYNTNLRETGRTAVSLKVDRESALSLSLKPNLAEAAKSILSDPTIFH